MVNEVLHEQWRGRLASFASEGKTVRAWCAEHEIPVHRFHYWRRRLKGPEPPRADWMAVAVMPESTRGGITVRIAGAAIEVHPGFDGALLRAVVTALQSVPGAGNAPC